MARMSRDLRAVGNFAFFGATCFLISAMIYIDGYAIEYMADLEAPGGFEASMRLNVTNLQARWEGRRKSQAPYLMAELFGAAGWFSLMPVISCLCELLGGETRSATKIVSSCFHAVAMLTLVDLTFQAGTISLVDWVSTWPPIRDADEHHAADGGFGALQALEIAFMVGESRTTWLFAMDELLLVAGWGTAAFLICTQRGSPGQRGG